MADEEEVQWVPDRAVTRAALAGIDVAQSAWPVCRLCGQRTVKLDRFGLCSKTSKPHQEWRAEVRADMKAGAR